MAAKKKTAKKAAKKKTAKKSAKAKATNVDRLHKAGALKVAKEKLSKRHHDALNKLSKAEVDALIRVSKKVGSVTPPKGQARPWFV